MTRAPVLRITRHFDFSAERVFDSWLDPECARRWLFTAPGGEIVRAEIDARIGGAFTFTDQRGNEAIDHVGHYLEIDRPRRLVFTFGVPTYSPDMTRVSIEITPIAEGGCELVLTHEGMPMDYTDRTTEGWTMILGNLAATLGRGTMIDTDAVRFERLLPGPLERVWSYLADSDKRATWLASGTIEPSPGGAFRLRFDNSNLSAAKAPPPEAYRQHDGIKESNHTVLRWEPPSLLAFTWDNGRSEVTMELTPRGDRVLLVLTHRLLGTPAARLQVSGGWHTHLDILADRLEGREPKAFWPSFSRNAAVYGLEVEAKEEAK